jgi:hypothetical protein
MTADDFDQRVANLGSALPTNSTFLSEWLQILTKDQIQRRATAFINASRFIVNASLGGGIGPPGPPSFNARDPHVPDARVDIEVQAGLAFVP